MTTDLKGRIQEGFDELETEIQAREAAGQTKGKPRAVGFADDARNGPYGNKPTIGAGRQYKTVYKITDRSRVDGKYNYDFPEDIMYDNEYCNEILERAGAVRKGDKLYVDVATAMGRDTDEAIDALTLLAEDVGVELKPVTYTENGVVKTGFYIENTPKGINFLDQTFSEGRIRTSSACLRSAVTVLEVNRAREIRVENSAIKYWRRAGLVKKIGTAGAIYAAWKFFEEACGAISSGNVVEDGVSVQTPMPEQYRGQVSPADQKYFTKGSPEEAKFRAMVGYAAMQEGGFMGMTQEEWLEYAMRLRQAEGGIISPTGELKIRKALVEAYDKYQATVDKSLALNLGGNANSDATRGLQNAGAESVDAGRGAPAASRRRGGSRGGF